MNDEKMEQLHHLNVELVNRLKWFVENEKQLAYQDSSFEWVVAQFFWRYVRSCLMHTANNPHFMTYLQHQFWSVDNHELDDEVRKDLENILWPQPSHINKWMLSGSKAVWDYSDPTEESNSIVNWMPGE